MQRNVLKKYNLPDVPGVYLFKQGRKVLYVGKATSLRDRVRSYFDDDLIITRGPRVVDMVTKADRIAHETTPTILEALVREAVLIKKYHPAANSEGKDDKTFLYAVVTKEDIPRVLVVRGKEIDFAKLKIENCKLRAAYGPFPSGAQLKEGLKLIRKIFPFFDTPKPVLATSKHHRAHVEFNTQIRRYPREYNAKEYRRTIRHVMLFLSGRGKELRVVLGKEMKQAAKEERFEDAVEARRELFALDHIQDVSLIKDEWRPQGDTSRQGNSSPRGVSLPPLRIEAYDTAHLGGTNAIGVMTVLVDGSPIKKEYRTFNIKGVKKNDDIASLKEILSRRFGHPEWEFPKVVVVDGGKAQKKAAETVLAEFGMKIPVVAVVKDEKHNPREIIGMRTIRTRETDVILANFEAHRFSLAKHRQARTMR